MPFPVTLLGMAALFVVAASSAVAAIRTVEPDGSGDYPTIQDALDAAVSGDEIVLGDGTFLGPRNRDLVFLGKNLTLGSAAGDPAQCVIDCQGASRGLRIIQGETAAVVEGITIRNGFGPQVGGPPASPGWGGGVYLNNVTATFRNCVITQCAADDAPGGALGAGAYAIGSHVTFEDCDFIDNAFALRGTGAGLFAWGNSVVTATRCRFVGNRAPGTTAGGSGGGVRAQDSALTLIDCEIVGNLANVGAGISTGQFCAVDFRDCLVAGNANNTAGGSSQAAGIQFGYDTDGTVRSCTIVGNRAFNLGAGIHVASDCNLEIENTIIWGNCIGAGTGESAYIQFDGTVHFTCSDIDPAKVVGGTVTYTTSLTIDPMFCAAEPCANAPTAAGSYTLDAGSPLVNAPSCGRIGRSGVGCGTSDVPGPVAPLGLQVRATPNPFRGATAIDFMVAEPGDVILEIFDIVGRRVRRFDVDARAAGPGSIQWDGRSQEGSSATAGVYFVRLTSRRGVATTEVVLFP